MPGKRKARSTRSSRGVSVRVMYTDKGSEKLYEEVLNAVVSALKARGFKVRVSRGYPNRKGVGERVYISVTK